MVAVGLVVAGIVILTTQYDRGVNHLDSWSTRVLPAMPLDTVQQQVSELEATGELADAVAAGGLERLGMVQLNAAALGWVLAGLGLVVGTAILRLRAAWWPIHPVLFVVWGVTPIAHFAMSFLLGWAVKNSIVGLGGARGYHAAKPLMIGAIAGELLAALLWTIVGAIAFALSGESPPVVRVFPG
jgi:hypothetical protein